MSAASEPPAPLAAPARADLVLRLDVGGERSVARLRLAGAIFCGLGALAMALLGPPLVGWILVALGALAAVGWTISFSRARGRTSAPTAYSLALRADALELQEAGRTVTVPWADVRAAEVDEDRLVVLVHRRGEPRPLVLEPRYEGTSVYALCALVAQRVAGAASQTPSAT